MIKKSTKTTMNIINTTSPMLFVCAIGGSGAEIGPRLNPKLNTNEKMIPIKLVKSIASAIEQGISRCKKKIKPIMNVTQIIILKIHPTHLESFSIMGAKIKIKNKK
jgi:hypothetical protein